MDLPDEFKGTELSDLAGQHISVDGLPCLIVQKSPYTAIMRDVVGEEGANYAKRGDDPVRIVASSFGATMLRRAGEINGIPNYVFIDPNTDTYEEPIGVGEGFAFKGSDLHAAYRQMQAYQN